ncbi:unnamed protein product [Notodromas monacha]|uniref:non-specific serine/threonine protein kinase n=1 Tax=Notodromas monacha TaxID=399045 RepID=A0A7R9GCX0_9CRUS|nr:unnamed protein product [Notodromas monacha]CAG0917917.1 unnamed protein product [Notodromas monacha]
MAAKGKCGNPRKRPSPGVPIPTGTILEGCSYVSKVGRWRLGKNIGVGGFGVIFTASAECGKDVSSGAEYVAKIEPFDNGPLFTEFHAMQRMARPEFISEWKQRNKLSFLGLPQLVGFGNIVYNSVKYRFVIMDRYGEDIHKLFEDSGRRLPTATICKIGLKVVDILEYIHSKGYTHNDIKGANLLIGYGGKKKDAIFLIDFGLARNYLIGGKHMEYKHDRRFAHNGTREYTCRDAHMGVTSRRGDLETLGYCMALWEIGTLPWESESDDNKVHTEKNNAFKNTTAFLQKAFSSLDKKRTPPKFLLEFFKYVGGLKFDETPDYDKFRSILFAGLKECGGADDGKLNFPHNSVKMQPGKQRRRASNEENIEADSPKPSDKGKKKSRRSISSSPRPPLRNKQRFPSPEKSCVSSKSTESSAHDVGLMFPAQAMNLMAKYPALKDKLKNRALNGGRRDSSEFRRESEILEKRIKAGTVSHVQRESGKDSNTIAGVKPSPMRGRRRLARNETSDDEELSEHDERLRELGPPTSHMVAVMQKTSESNTSSGRSGSKKRSGKAASKIDLAVCSSIPTPAMLQYMQSRPDHPWGYSSVANGVPAVVPAKPQSSPGIRSSARLRAKK